MSILPKFAEKKGSGTGSIHDILSKTKEGFATPNRYEVIITGPSKRKKKAISIDQRKISLFCTEATLPARSLESSPDNNIYGVAREVVNRPLYAGDIVLTFFCSHGAEERIFFEEWQQNAFDPTTWDVGYYDDYIGVVDIYLLDKSNIRYYGVRLHEAYPKEVQPILLSYAQSTDIIKVNISMQYRYWDTLDENRLQVSSKSINYWRSRDTAARRAAVDMDEIDEI
tara:strand:+ start:17 stop:694 length:678 start_codon:yes stop_codon:yes gene_type:complete